MDNSPHVLFFKPIISELEKQGQEVIITARDCFQTCELLDLFQYKYVKIGRHFGRNIFMKTWGVILRTFKLVFFAYKKNFSLAVSHGSRSMILAAFFLRIPAIINIFDYEYSRFGLFIGKLPTKFLVPHFLQDEILKKKVDINRVVKYPGLKEQIYLKDFRPDYSLLEKLSIDPMKIVITLRPPATEANYHNPKSEKILKAVLLYLAKHKNVVLVILPRTIRQKREISRILSKNTQAKIIFPEKVIHGLSLIWISDAVIGGGGTMNREGAVLNTHAYSIFKGNIGAVDRYLANQGKITFIQSPSDVERIRIEKKKNRSVLSNTKEPLDFIVKEIINSPHNL